MATDAPDRGTQDSGQQTPDRPPRRDPRLGLVVARPFGIPVYISPYWLIFAVVLVVMYANSLETNIVGVANKYVVAAAFVLLLYASVLVHELAHCVVARRFGLPVRRVLLYPLGGYSEIEQEPATPGREALVSAAGPAISLVLAGLGYLLARAVSAGLPHQLITQLFLANLIVGIFNLLPGLPLDGGRIFRAGVWKITGKQASATVAAAWAGRVLAIILVGLGLASQRASSGSFLNLYWIWLLIIAGFIWIQSTQAIRAARIRERLPAVTARTLARRAIPVLANLPLAEAIRRAQAADARALVVVDHENTPTAIVSESAVQATPLERRPWIEAGSLARTLDPGIVLSADLTGMDLIKAVQQTPASEYLLIEPTGQVFGVLATADLDLAFAGV
ncbi:MAG TPA: site-2 protease family protein [Streptosporangiaceae bacterium]|nr:site-2 protease family protein [Streptosporangiaceae bacterium]